MKMPTEMTTQVAVKCALCSKAVVVAVNAMSLPSMITEAIRLADLLAVHLVSVHHAEIPPEAPTPTKEEVAKMFKTAMDRSRGVIESLS